MAKQYVIALHDPQATLERAGGKGASLARLANAGLPTPGGFHVTTGAYREFVSTNDLQRVILTALDGVDLSVPSTLEAVSLTIRSSFAQAEIPPDIAAEIIQAYMALPGGDPAVAVRSSATAEDLPGASFAGQQETYLNVSGPSAVVEATRKCWASLWTARAIGYRARQGIPHSDVALAVVVQQLIPAESAGILFTADPVTGRRSQVVISAAWGLGEAVVGGLVTPDSYTVDKGTGRVTAKEIADKRAMTVRVDGGTRELTVPDNLRRAPALSDEQAAELARLGARIETLYGRPMDIEWALADGAFAILQARPITALPAPVAEPPSEWPMPNPKGHYMRSSIVELMPDPLSPLFATLGLRSITEGILGMAERLMKTPREAIPPDFMCTINGYAYQSVGFTRKQWFLILTYMLPQFPHMMRTGVTFWRETALPEYAAAVAAWRDRPLHDMPAAELFAGVRSVMEAFSFHLATLMGSTMGPSAGIEGVFTNVYNRLVKRPGDPAAPTFLLGFDSIPIQGEKALYDLATWCKERTALAAHLGAARGEQIAAELSGDSSPAGIPVEDWREWQGRFRQYLDRYGYSIYDLDFAKPLPMDDPAPILETFKLFLSGKGRSPHERQQALAGRREQALAAVRARLKRIKRWAFEKTLKWAQRQNPLREDGIAEIGLGYPVLRAMLRELGRRLAERVAIHDPDDIYWLEAAELETLAAALDRPEPLASWSETVEGRKREWQARKLVAPPPQLPPKAKVMGISMEAYLPADASSQTGDSIKGLGASPGRVTAPACVLRGPEDFDQMQPGGVLVAPITTPAWTPLFAMASGIVTDVGGPLSHSSIVAREYGIPAVLGTGVATARIHGGQTVTVDGGAGVVTLSPNGSHEPHS